MKTTILVITLTCVCIASTYAQMNPKNLERPDSLSRAHYDIKPTLSRKEIFKPNDFRSTTVEPRISNDGRGTTIIPGGALTQDNMHCYKPEGIFSMSVIAPDSTTRYTMLIKRD